MAWQLSYSDFQPGFPYTYSKYKLMNGEDDSSMKLINRSNRGHVKALSRTAITHKSWDREFIKYDSTLTINKQ